MIMMSVVFCPFYFSNILQLPYIFGNNAEDVETILEPSIIASHKVSVALSHFTLIIPLHQLYRLYLVYK